MDYRTYRHRPGLSRSHPLSRFRDWRPRTGPRAVQLRDGVLSIMSAASPPPTAPPPGDKVQFDDDGSTRTGTVKHVSWHPRFNHLARLVLVVDVGGTTRRVADGDLV